MEERNDNEGDHLPVVNYILEHLSPKDKTTITEQKINDILDFETDYYEQKGYFSEDVQDGDEVEIDEAEMVSFILDKTNNISEHEVLSVLDLELEYGQSIGMYE